MQRSYWRCIYFDKADRAEETAAVFGPLTAQSSV